MRIANDDEGKVDLVLTILDQNVANSSPPTSIPSKKKFKIQIEMENLFENFSDFPDVVFHYSKDEPNYYSSMERDCKAWEDYLAGHPDFPKGIATRVRRSIDKYVRPLLINDDWTLRGTSWKNLAIANITTNNNDKHILQWDTCHLKTLQNSISKTEIKVLGQSAGTHCNYSSCGTMFNEAGGNLLRELHEIGGRDVFFCSDKLCHSNYLEGIKKVRYTQRKDINGRLLDFFLNTSLHYFIWRLLTM